MKKHPNIIYIYADDLGRGLLSCYGQKMFETPNIDSIAQNGMKFERAYGCALCAPARASMITGIHDCHAGGWSYNSAGIYKHLNIDMSLNQICETINNSRYNYLSPTEFLPHILKKAGYYTGQIGKLEWGFATTKQDIMSHGWDYHYGYYDHQRCHGFYPPFLFENGEVVYIEGNTLNDCGVSPLCENEENYKKRWNMDGKKVYSQDLFNARIVEFIEKHKENSFFLYHPSQLPHGPVAVPNLHEKAKDIKGLTHFEKEYVSMVLRLDDTVGLIIDTLKKYHLLDDTMIIFSSDNGHEIYYEQENRTTSTSDIHTGKIIDEVNVCYTSKNVNDILDGNNGMKGKKRSNSEGGVRIPYIVSWRGKIPAGTVSNRLIANYDLMPTLAELAGVDMPYGKDGLSFYKELTGQASPEHEYVVYASHRGPGLSCVDGWKIRYCTEFDKFELYRLDEDYSEKNDLSKQYPGKLKELAAKLLKECDGNFRNGTPFSHKVSYINEILYKAKY